MSKGVMDLDGMQTEHPLLPRIGPEKRKAIAAAKGYDHVVKLIVEREQAIAAAKADPLRNGFSLDHWKDADRLLETHDVLLILGGNRAGKSEYMGRKVVELLMKGEEKRGWCLQTTDKTSIEMQQPIIYKYLPPEYRALKKGKVENVSYSEKGGFTEQTFVLPNHSRCRFLNYKMDISVVEGGELDVIWADELCPVEWFRTMLYRVVTRAGKLVLSFTPKNGYSMTVREFVAGGTVVESRPAPLLDPNKVHVRGCPPGHMPYIIECMRNNAAVICFFSELNPFGGYERIVKMLDGKSDAEIRIRAYGWADKLEGKAFPKFNKSVHVVEAAKVPARGTVYFSCDPAGGRNWFLKWYRVDEMNRVYLYREWPDMDRYGEWAVPGERPDGAVGPAQTADVRNGIVAYKRLMLEAEGWSWTGTEWARTNTTETVLERRMDPRMGGDPVPGQDDGTTIISLMADEQLDAKGNVIGPAMEFLPGAGGAIDLGIQVINDYLEYDDEQPVTQLNCPRFYISSACKQSIYVYDEYTGRDGLKGAMKDVVDPDRYVLGSNPMYVTEVELAVEGGF